MATAEFTFNNKVYTATKESPFKVNYGRELRMGFNIRKKGKNMKAEKFVKEMKDKHEEAKAALMKSQEEMKRQADRNMKEVEKYRVGNKVVTNFIQLVSPQPVDRFSQTKLCWKAPNEGYPHICGTYKSDNKQLRYQDISSCKSFIC